MRIRALTRLDAVRRARGRLAGEAGSLLVETMVSAVIVLTVGAGVLNMMDRGTQLSAQQRLLATASNIAQSEQERLHSLPVSGLSNLQETRPPRTVNGVVFTTTSRTDWVNDTSTADGTCASTATSTDYLKLTTTVTYPTIGDRGPLKLESLVTPPPRTFGPTQGSLLVRVKDRLDEPVSGLTINLTGPATLSDPTSAKGCVLWGYLTAGSYTVSAVRSGYVEPDGSATISDTVPVLGNQENTLTRVYDLAGAISAQFMTKRSAAASLTATPPQQAMVEHSDARFIAKAFPVTGNELPSAGGLFPFTSAYSIYAGACAGARPPAANAGSAVALPGSTGSAGIVQIPALNILVRNNGANVAGAVVKVTSCGITYIRTTDSAGLVSDPGFPYGTLAVCVSNGARKRQVASVANTTYPATAVTYDVGTSGSTAGACP